MLKRIFVSVGILSFVFFELSAQDIIVTKDSRRIEAKVTEVNIDDVKYKVFTHQDGPTYTLLKSDIVSILYQNGNVETFVGASSPTPANTVSTISKFQEYTEWYVGISAGYMIGRWNIPNSLGLHGAYFFNQKYGAGLTVLRCTDEDHTDLFLTPTFFAHWGRSDSKWFFPTKIGVGIDKFTHSEKRQGSFVEISEILLAFYASVGVAYRPSKLISFGINAELAFCDEGGGGYLGINAGISFHF